MPIGVGTAMVIAGGASAGASAYGAHKQASSANKSARLQTDAANQAAVLTSADTDKALQFQRDAEAERQREWKATQDRNYQIYQTEQAQTLGELAARRGRVAPFAQAGYGALRQMAQPIPGVPQGGTLADLARRP